MAKVKITLVRSTIKKSNIQKRTIEALGLRKLNHSVEKELNPAIEGMIKTVQHLIKVEKI
ncbi:MAG: 50S ribosomal protein L30 [Bacteroidia bacterium]|jgi:large subunit ribosomal protein L30|nr:50S ribosomal protein L30 [Bacteroidia bacterium]